jgi:hypothetical protein
MSSRKKPVVITILIVAVLLLIGGWVGLRMRSATLAAQNNAFYTTDDGKTWFVADASHIPPFDHDGKVAVEAKIFTCDGGKTLFCGYMEKFDPEVKKLFDIAEKNPGNKVAILNAKVAAMSRGPELKKPGAIDWVKRTNRTSYAQVTSVDRNGSPAELVRP